MLAQHVQHLEWRNYARSTIYQRQRAIHRLACFLAPAHLMRATTADLLRFLARLKNPPARSTEISHLAGFFRWAVLEGFREDDPTIRVPRPRTKKWLPHPMPELELRRAIDEAPERVRPWLYLAAYGGLRACEIAPLRADDLWWDSDPALIIVRHGKGDDPDSVPIAPVLEVELRKLPRHGLLFARHDGQAGPLRAHNISQTTNNYLHRIGISLTLHSLRHRFGTQVLRASGGNLRQTQELLRHRSIASTTIYTLVEKSETYGVVAALPVA